MPNLRADLQRKASGAFIEHALTRIESALLIAGTLLLSFFNPVVRFAPEAPFPWWIWTILGSLGWLAIIYSSLTDPQTSAKVMSQLLREQLALSEIKDKTLRQRVDAMVDYVREVEADLYRLKATTKHPALKSVADQVVDWTEQGSLLARYADTYRRDHRIEARRQALPGMIESLVARLKYERRPDIVDRLNAEMEALGKDWEALKLLDAQMQQAEPQLAQTLTALARATSEMHVIADSVDVGQEALAQDQLDHLQQDVQRHGGQITDLVSQINRLYNQALEKD
jgi:chromosome segregation ATPase